MLNSTEHEFFSAHKCQNANNIGCSDGAMVLGKLPVPGRPTIWMTVGQGLILLAVGAGGFFFRHFYSHLSFLSSFSLSLGDGPISTEILSQRAFKPKQATNQPANNIYEREKIAF